MACRSGIATICLNPVQSTPGVVHSLGCVMCTAHLKVTLTHLVLLSTSSASGLAFSSLDLLHLPRDRLYLGRLA